MFLNKSANAKKHFFSSPSISRNSLLWLFVIQVFVLAPHFVSSPWWIAIVWLGVVFWRWRIFQGAGNYPNKLHKTFMVFICSAGLVVSLGLSFNFMSMISLLLVGFTLKLLEVKNRKDFILLVYIAFFILATQFIVFNHFIAAVYGFFCLALLCTLLMQLYQNPVLRSSALQKNALQKNITLKKVWLTLNPSIFILLQAIPFMFILFVVMPRLGSFWSVPSPQQAKTGMSDTMSPGDISELIQSDELAFRVTFAGKTPAKEKLYWRSLVLSAFDGRRWSQAFAAKNPQQFIPQGAQALSSPVQSWWKKIEYLGDKTTYDIIAEPSGRPWLYVLAAPEVWSNRLILGDDLHLQAILPINQRISYKVTSALNYRFEASGQDSIALRQNLQLPDNVNPETRRVALEWYAETGSTEKLIEKVFNYYRESFFYTLQPPSLGGDSVDEFLWQSRQGFCEHFSSSFVFFLRAAGIPARVVVGYQGGELNSIENYLVVSQRDAHAWAEVWISGRGWVLMDPTAAVAPERIRRGIAESLNATDQKLLSQQFGSSLKFLISLRDQWDALNFQWIRWVMNYDSSLQSSLLNKLLHNLNPLRLALFVLVAGGIAMMLIFAILFFRSHHKNFTPAERATQFIYQQLTKKLKQCGVTLEVGETPRQLVLRAVNLRPDLAPILHRIINSYEQLVYAENTTVLPHLKRDLATFSIQRQPEKSSN
jgi:protein-glutamine gamma-glutamyltransferase